MTLWDEVMSCKATAETVIVNSYGDTAQQIVNDPDWEAKFARYQRDEKIKEEQRKLARLEKNLRVV